MSLTKEDLRRTSHLQKQAYNRHSPDVPAEYKSHTLERHYVRIDVWDSLDATRKNQWGQIQTALKCAEAQILRGSPDVSDEEKIDRLEEWCDNMTERIIG